MTTKRWKVLMKDRNGVRVKLFIDAQTSKEASDEAQLEREDCTVEHVVEVR